MQATWAGSMAGVFPRLTHGRRQGMGVTGRVHVGFRDSVSEHSLVLRRCRRGRQKPELWGGRRPAPIWQEGRFLARQGCSQFCAFGNGDKLHLNLLWGRRALAPASRWHTGCESLGLAPPRGTHHLFLPFAS